MGAGDYPDRMRRLVRSVSKDAVGQDVEQFTPGNYYWGRVEEDNGRRQRDYGANQTGSDATLYVRQYPDLSPLDRLEDAYGRVWVIDSLRYGDNELILDCYQFDGLVV